jgi:FixJ family two-component response regulator
MDRRHHAPHRGEDLDHTVAVPPGSQHDGVPVAGVPDQRDPAPDQPVILVVDDDPDVAQALEDTLRLEFEVVTVTAPRSALSALDDPRVAVLLADQRMPDMDGVELLTEARRLRPDVVGILITAYADVGTAIQAINEARTFGYLAKPWDADELLSFLRRAVDAHRVLRHDRRAQHERELRILDQFSRAAPAPVTGHRFGAAPLREGLPDLFDELCRQYADLVEHAFEQRVYKVEHPISDALHGLADRLGGLRAGPRDVVDLHTVVMRRRLTGASADQADAYAEEGRLLILELMGHLVSYYRGYSLG